MGMTLEIGKSIVFSHNRCLGYDINMRSGHLDTIPWHPEITRFEIHSIQDVNAGRSDCDRSAVRSARPPLAWWSGSHCDWIRVTIIKLHLPKKNTSPLRLLWLNCASTLSPNSALKVTTLTHTRIYVPDQYTLLQLSYETTKSFEGECIIPASVEEKTLKWALQLWQWLCWESPSITQPETITYEHWLPTCHLWGVIDVLCPPPLVRGVSRCIWCPRHIFRRHRSTGTSTVPVATVAVHVPHRSWVLAHTHTDAEKQMAS